MYTLLHFVLVVSKQIFVFLVQKFSLMMMSSFFLSVHDLVYFVGIMGASIDQNAPIHLKPVVMHASDRL
jgi:hypothetical protein